MKFTTNFKFIAILALITLSFISAKKMSVKTEDGSGDWDNGFNCPKIMVADKNQGSATIYAKDITTQSGDNVYSILFKFSSAPGAEFKKIARDAGGNKWRVAYRKLSNDFGYVNPWGNKYISGTVYDEAGKASTFKIVLPHKTFGWYINDDQGNKITNAINTSSTTRSQNVAFQKQVLRKQFPNYSMVKTAFENLSKNKAAYEKYVEEKKKTLADLKGKIDGLRSNAAEAQKKVETSQREFMDAKEKLENLLSIESALGSRKTSIVESIEALTKNEGDMASKKAMFTKDVADVKKILDDEFDSLKANITPKVAEADAAKRDLYAMKKADYESHMKKIYP